MLHRFLFPAAVALGALAGCRHCADTPTPTTATRPCYSGVVVDQRCYDGLLIKVDSVTPIGRPYGNYRNVIGALNTRQVGSLGQKGQRIFFTCSGDTTGFADFGACPAFGIPANVPHVLLRTFSGTGCPSGSAPQ